MLKINPLNYDIGMQELQEVIKIMKVYSSEEICAPL